MARITFPGLKAYGDALEQLELALNDDDFLADVVWAGAQPVADEVRRQIENIPTGELEHNSEGRLYRSGPSSEAKQAMLDELGIAPPLSPEPGDFNVKVGFDGFYGVKTKRHPRGFPVKLEAYQWEHGTSFNPKHPFIRPAVNATRKKAVGEMDKVFTDGLKNIFKE